MKREISVFGRTDIFHVQRYYAKEPRIEGTRGGVGTRVRLSFIYARLFLFQFPELSVLPPAIGRGGGGGEKAHFLITLATTSRVVPRHPAVPFPFPGLFPARHCVGALVCVCVVITPLCFNAFRVIVIIISARYTPEPTATGRDAGGMRRKRLYYVHNTI